CTASMTELWNWPITALALSCDASFLSPATPFSGVPESSSMTSSIFRPPSTPPGPLISSAAILAPRTMNWPAAASPGGDNGVSTPILTGPWARAGVATRSAAAAASRHETRDLRIMGVLQVKSIGSIRAAWYEVGPAPSRSVSGCAVLAHAPDVLGGPAARPFEAHVLVARRGAGGGLDGHQPVDGEAARAEQGDTLGIGKVELDGAIGGPLEPVQAEVVADEPVGHRGVVVRAAQREDRGVLHEDEAPARTQEPRRLGHPDAGIAPDAGAVFGER